MITKCGIDVDVAIFIQFSKIRAGDSRVAMAERNPTWAVVATVDEPAALVQAFVAWHLHLGAAEVWLYFDRPDDPAADLFGHLPQVHVIRCDAPHWLRLGKSRPRRHEVRQVGNARDAYARCTADWLLHCDADEFVWSNVPMAEVLSGCAAATDSLILPVAERMHPPGSADHSVLEGVFRRPYPEAHNKGLRIFGPDYDLTYRGLTGHAQGKAFARTGRPLHLSIHRPRPARAGQVLQFARASSEVSELLHFEGLTPAYWSYKLARMAHALAKHDGMPPSAHRRRQADVLLAEPQNAADLYARLKVADERLQALLQRRDLWSAPAFDPTGALSSAFPDAAIDLSPSAIDRWLHQEKGSILAFLRAP